jgi:hypothetical protein
MTIESTAGALDDVTPDGAAPTDPEAFCVDGQTVLAYSRLVSQVAIACPDRTVSEIEAVALREAEAFLGGRHIVLPLELRDAVIEVLRQGAGDASY